MGGASQQTCLIQKKGDLWFDANLMVLRGIGFELGDAKVQKVLVAVLLVHNLYRAVERADVRGHMGIEAAF